MQAKTAPVVGTYAMKTMFNETMTSSQAQRIFFDYAAAHKGENIEDVKAEYCEVSRKIIRRELTENEGYMTSYQFV